jgi:hypothetical protein
VTVETMMLQRSAKSTAFSTDEKLCSIVPTHGTQDWLLEHADFGKHSVGFELAGQLRAEGICRNDNQKTIKALGREDCAHCVRLAGGRGHHNGRRLGGCGRPVTSYCVDGAQLRCAQTLS